MEADGGEFRKRSTRSVLKARPQLSTSRRRRTEPESEQQLSESLSQSQLHERQTEMKPSPQQRTEPVQGDEQEEQSGEIQPTLHRSSRTFSKRPHPRARRRNAKQEAGTVESIAQGEVVERENKELFPSEQEQNEQEETEKGRGGANYQGLHQSLSYMVKEIAKTRVHMLCVHK